VAIRLLFALLISFDPLPRTGLLCAGLAGLAVFLVMRHPAGELRRVTTPRSRFTVVTVPLARLVRGRPDAPPLLRRLLLSAACAVALGLAAAQISTWPRGLIWATVPIIAITGLVVLGWLEPRSARDRQRQLIMETPQALELLAACLAAGLPARTACAAVVQAFEGPVADDLGRVLALLQLGAGEVSAWRAIDDHPQLGMAAADLARSVESGTSLVEGLQHHAAAAREARRAALQVRARAVGVRSVLPMMICFLPSFMLLGIVPAVVSAVFNAFG
jgi:pilus assembly protein TadC